MIDSKNIDKISNLQIELDSINFTINELIKRKDSVIRQLKIELGL